MRTESGIRLSNTTRSVSASRMSESGSLPSVFRKVSTFAIHGGRTNLRAVCLVAWSFAARQAQPRYANVSEFENSKMAKGRSAHGEGREGTQSPARGSPRISSATTAAMAALPHCRDASGGRMGARRFKLSVWRATRLDRCPHFAFKSLEPPRDSRS